MDPLRQHRQLQEQIDRLYGAGRLEQIQRDFDRLYGADRMATLNRQIDQTYGAGRVEKLHQQIDRLYGTGRLEQLQKQIDQAYGAGRMKEIQGQIDRMLRRGRPQEAFSSGPLENLRTELSSSALDENAAQDFTEELSEFETSIEEVSVEIADDEEAEQSQVPFSWASQLSRANKVRLFGAAVGLLAATISLAATPDQTPPLTIALLIGVLIPLIEMLAIAIEEDSD